MPHADLDELDLATVLLACDPDITDADLDAVVAYLYRGEVTQ